jgi:hypothetical protein
MPVRIEGAMPAPGTPIRRGAEEVGEIRSGQDGVALALLRLEALATADALDAAGATVRPVKPDWARF